MTQHLEGNFTGAAGDRIYWQSWLPESVSAVVVISHGVAEHSGRYEHLANELADNGYAVYAIDHHGHGKSAGNRSNIDRMAGVVSDLDTLIGMTGESHPGLPIFLLGHSMGSLVALQYVTGSPRNLRGLVVSAPPLEITVGSSIERAAAPVLSRLLPNLPVLQLDSSEVSRDPKVVHDYDTDPLNFRGRLPVRTGAEVLATAQNMRGRLSQLSLPVLILQGSADKLVDPIGAQVVADGVSSPDMTLKIYDGLYHEVFNEPEKATVIDDLVAWLKAHL
ncbi:lysophospholipase [Antrihabitans sp. YC3-6]|uniref:Monoacylglycerol lipase n=1 Tax=Antrihabitans stalagmiti TaxID=2799499 RepID=A0A934NLX6_9NOCA|nr:alpha/beta hydrolase [Antrihabitans stalagmiti]MBJ8337554.1 lysophospholipase [Antrihabitans stalagmiti]